MYVTRDQLYQVPRERKVVLGTNYLGRVEEPIQ